MPLVVLSMSGQNENVDCSYESSVYDNDLYFPPNRMNLMHPIDVDAVAIAVGSGVFSLIDLVDSNTGDFLYFVTTASLRASCNLSGGVP
jgi:hypothetical protein